MDPVEAAPFVLLGMLAVVVLLLVALNHWTKDPRE